MPLADRILELRRLRAGDLQPHPRNWRTHPPEQRAAVTSVLAEIGYADALLARELPSGAIELIDGHLRAQLDPDQIVPVLIVDLTDAEAETLLAVFDPITDMAGADPQLLQEVLARTQTHEAALESLFQDLQRKHLPPPEPEAPVEPPIPTSFQVVAECPDEASQRELFDRLTHEDYKCRLLTF